MFVEEDDSVDVNYIKPVNTNVSKEPTATKWYMVELPSAGKLGYPKIIEYRDILVRDEKVISTATEKTSTLVLNNVLKDLIKDCDSWFYNMSVMDQQFLLMWIWANNYSTKKHLTIKCRNCGHKDKHIVDLTEVDVKNLSDDYVQPFEYKLQNDEIVKLRLVTIGDEKLADDMIEKNPHLNRDYVLMTLTTDFSTVMTLDQKMAYFDNHVSGRDVGMIRAFHNHFKYGLDDNIPHKCSKCEEVTNFSIPFSLQHFLPTLSNDFASLLRSNKTVGD